jgi:hypothetical protein
MKAAEKSWRQPMKSWRASIFCASLIVTIAGHTALIEAAISSVTRGTYDLRDPVNKPIGGSLYYYNSAIVIQLDATTAGLLASIRRNGTPWYDYEAGIDLVVFNTTSGLNAATIVPISRPAYEHDPENPAKLCLTSVFPMYGGFVPRGAAVGNGRPHPHAGTGFGIKLVGFYPAKTSRSWPRFSHGRCTYRLELQQFSYDGAQFTAGEPVRMSASGLRVGETDRYIDMPGFSPAIPDGNDLLFPVLCKNGANGVARFQHGPNGWQPVSFTPVTTLGNESSLIRGADGALLFSTRESTTYRLWRSLNGKDWNLQLIAGMRLATPVILSQAADGTPYFSGNPPSSYPARNTLQITPVNQARNGLATPITIIDGHASWGDSPDSNDPDKNPDGWYIDHGYGNVVRLSDGQWHSVFVHRVLAQAEQDGSPATPHTGLYMEEVFSNGDAVPTWTFVATEPSCGVLLLIMVGFLAAGCLYWNRQ